MASSARREYLLHYSASIRERNLARRFGFFSTSAMSRSAFLIHNITTLLGFLQFIRTIFFAYTR
jgi:hypothetical protein